METVFGSLYMDEVIIEPKCVISVLATATLFQLDELINRCAEVMSETVNAEVKKIIFQFLRMERFNFFKLLDKYWLL